MGGEEMMEGMRTPRWTPVRSTEAGGNRGFGAEEEGEEGEGEPHRAPDVPAGREEDDGEEEEGRDASPGYFHSTLACLRL